MEKNEKNLMVKFWKQKKFFFNSMIVNDLKILSALFVTISIFY